MGDPQQDQDVDVPQRGRWLGVSLAPHQRFKSLLLKLPPDCAPLLQLYVVSEVSTGLYKHGER